MDCCIWPYDEIIWWRSLVLLARGGEPCIECDHKAKPKEHIEMSIFKYKDGGYVQKSYTCHRCFLVRQSLIDMGCCWYYMSLWEHIEALEKQWEREFKTEATGDAVA